MTNKIDFAGSTLFISARSPFARRVRAALIEAGISYEEQVFDVFKPTLELFKANPLGRVPAIRLASGVVLVESHIILEAFYASIASPLTPATPSESASAHRWSGLVMGLCEKIVEYYLETLRPEAHRDPEILDEVHAIVSRVLPELDSALGERDTILPSGRLCQADLDLACMLAYLTLRYPPIDWQARYPRLARYLKAMEARPSLERTRPPAA